MKGGSQLTALSIVLLAAACQTVSPPSPPSSNSPAPLARAAQVERVWIDDPQYRVYVANEMIVDGDRDIVVGVDFTEPPRHDQVEPRLRASVPVGSVIQWPNDTRVTMRVPPGGGFAIDLSGATPAPNSSLTSLTFRIDRPTYEIGLYRANDVLANSVTPVRSWTVHLAVQHIISIAPDGHRVIVYHGITPRHTEFSLLDLDTGRKSSLAAPFMDMAANGTSLMDWLPDGRLFGAAHATSFVGDADGQHPLQLPGLVGQRAVFSPSRHLVALWSYAESTAAVLDLTTGKLQALPGTFPRCTVGGIVSLFWIDDDRVAISDCTVDLEGTPRTRVLSARTGATLQTRLGDQLVAALAGGVEWRARVTPAHAMTSPHTEQWLVDRAGRVIATLDEGVRYLLAPDGTALAYAKPDRQRSVVIDPATGNKRDLIGEAMTWTKQGEVAIIRRL